MPEIIGSDGLKRHVPRRKRAPRPHPAVVFLGAGIGLALPVVVVLTFILLGRLAPQIYPYISLGIVCAAVIGAGVMGLSQTRKSR